jgi:anti-sigma regulatory factor (Ser/Thr protein kinase)
MVRVLKDRHDEETSARINNVFKTFSGYVHANYSHIMETYNGGALDFNLAGVPSVQQRQMRMEAVELAANSVLYAAAYIAHTVGLKKLHDEIVQSWQ